MIRLIQRISQLNEVDRHDLILKGKSSDDNSRYLRRMTVQIPKVVQGVNINDLINNDTVTATMSVGDYDVTVSFEGFWDYLINVAKTTPSITLQSVIRAIRLSYSRASNVKVNCTCGDYIYRHKYWATKLGYNYGDPENRPADITNPTNNKGPVCKHLSRLLSNGTWLVKVASSINNLFRKYSDLLTIMVYDEIEDTIDDTQEDDMTNTDLSDDESGIENQGTDSDNE